MPTGYATWLADAAAMTGYPVVEVAGWPRRGRAGFDGFEGVVLHHTADGPGEYPSLGVVRDGRRDLAGPLANYGLGRSGTVYVVAAGVARHAGTSAWAGFTNLNTRFLGIEAESRGTVNDWTEAQLDCYPRLAAAALLHMGRGADRVCGHLECALPRGRKVDPAFIDLDAFRARVDSLLGDPARRIPARAGAGLMEVEMIDLPVSPGRSVTLVVPSDAGQLVVSLGWTSMTVQSVAFFGSSPATGTAQLWRTDAPLRIDAGRPWQIAVPSGSVTAEITYSLGAINNLDVHAVAGFRR